MNKPGLYLCIYNGKEYLVNIQGINPCLRITSILDLNKFKNDGKFSGSKPLIKEIEENLDKCMFKYVSFSTEVIIEKEITRQVVEAHKSSIDYQFLKKAMGWYLAWVLLHLGFLLIGADSILSDGYNDEFVPFSKNSDMDEYDIREFLVYTIFPFAILVIWSMVGTQSNTDNNEQIQNN